MDASIFFAALRTASDDGLEIHYNAEFNRTSNERIIMPLNTVSGEVLRTGRPVIIRQPEDWDRVRSVAIGDALNPASALIASQQRPLDRTIARPRRRCDSDCLRRARPSVRRERRELRGWRGDTCANPSRICTTRGVNRHLASTAWRRTALRTRGPVDLDNDRAVRIVERRVQRRAERDHPSPRAPNGWT